ncbi:MAG: hypothetical protein R6U50_17555 [Desulfobacterales bacterium]
MTARHQRISSGVPDQKNFDLKSYSVHMPLDKLVLGTDNIRFDVFLSHTFVSAAKKISLRLIARHADSEPILRTDKTTNWIKERDDFIRCLTELLAGATTKAKASKEVQIDYLAQAAVVKLLLEVMKEQYDTFIMQYREVIRIQEVTDREDQQKTFKMKAMLAVIGRKKNIILYNACRELFGYFEEVQEREANEAREANFGLDAILNQDLFSNPMLFVDNPFYDFFMIDQYDILLGHRLEDPDKYDTLLFTLKKLFNRMDNAYAIFPATEYGGIRLAENSDPGKFRQDSRPDALDSQLRQVENIDQLFNYFQTRRFYRAKKKAGASRAELGLIRSRLKLQKKLLSYIYKHLNKTGLVKRIIAFQEVKGVYPDYCPPLQPQQVLQFLISGKHRKKTIHHLRRLKGYYAEPIDLKPLKKRIRNLEKINTHRKKECLIAFLKGIARFHRDYLNCELLKHVMDKLNLVMDENLLNLSRTNNTLYEYVLPHEEMMVEKPILNHVIVKADIRGSTDITYRMKESGLNPASYFSLNFFNPITDILPAYGAVKVFLEGDAMILAVYKQKDKPGEGYHVARACGLALNTLFIVQQYNKKSKAYRLPILELGIGICYHDSSPAFLFDGNHKIMISSAINLADRLSACSKQLRRIKQLNESPFNLHVFQDADQQGSLATVDDMYVRYNINGIELNEAGFQQLREEIDLKVLDYTIVEDRYTLYGGKFPTVSGKYQHVIVREARIPIIDLKKYRITGFSTKKYYEVCTYPKLYEVLKRS